jgi:hypothetical protein
MTITFAWWAWPIAALLVGIFGAVFLSPRSQGAYDFGAAFISLAWVIAGLALAIGLLIGHFV